MRTVQPMTGAHEATLAVSQPEYEPLVVAVYYDADLGSTVLLGVTPEQLAEMGLPREGKRDLYLGLATFGGRPQPMSLQVGDDGLRPDSLYSNYRIPTL